MIPSLVESASAATPLVLVSKRGYKSWLGGQDAVTKRWLEALSFDAEAGKTAIVPDKTGEIARVVVGVKQEADMWALAHLPGQLPPRIYRLEAPAEKNEAARMALGWALGAYRFTRYRKNEAKLPQLALPRGVDAAYVQAMAESTYLARDLINTPTNDMLPTQLSAAAMDVAKSQRAKAQTLVGEELLKANYPLIYTVGKASADAPRLVDLRWGKTNAPKVTLVGKGVCFDSGGLDIKPSSAMRLMKKDMGGAAIVLALARVIMARKLNVQLRVLLPIVENAISGNAMRPLDIVKSRKGLTVEIGNTDAEGRLILCDALAEADSEKPDLLIDCSTLTGAARIALGTDIPAFFTPDDALANALARHSQHQQDPLYRLPLWQPYRDSLKSAIADISNDPDSSYGGAINAAMYLKEFVEQTRSWLHLDMMAWNLNTRPGRPAGGEAQGLRALYALIEERYA